MADMADMAGRRGASEGGDTIDNTIHYTLYTIHYTIYTIHYTLYTIHYEEYQRPP